MAQCKRLPNTQGQVSTGTDVTGIEFIPDHMGGGCRRSISRCVPEFSGGLDWGASLLKMGVLPTGRLATMTRVEVLHLGQCFAL